MRPFDLRSALTALALCLLPLQCLAQTIVADVERVVGEVSAQAQFMIGFIYSEELKNYDEAEKAFNDLLQHYPNSELVESAHWMIAHMRSEDAPALVGADSDSARHPAPKGAVRKP